MIECPLKPGLICAATAMIIIDGLCVSACPRADKEIFNNPWDAFGRKFSYNLPAKGAAV